MPVCKVNTFGPLFRLTGDMDRWFDQVCGRANGFSPEVSESGPSWVPPIDVAENEKEITVRVEVPGVDPKDIEVTVSDRVLTISGEKQESRESKDNGVRHSERRFGSFRRTIQLPKSVDTNHIKAEHSHGVLQVRLNKSESVIPKRIRVEVAKD